MSVTITNPQAAKLLDALVKKHRCRSDAQLARLLEVAPPVISKVRHGHLPFGASLILNALILTGLSYPEFIALAEPEKVAA